MGRVAHAGEIVRGRLVRGRLIVERVLSVEPLLIVVAFRYRGFTTALDSDAATERGESVQRR